MQEHHGSITPAFRQPSPAPWQGDDWWHSGPDLPGALATTDAAYRHGRRLARAERHLAGNAIGPKRRRRYRRLLARVG